MKTATLKPLVLILTTIFALSACTTDDVSDTSDGTDPPADDFERSTDGSGDTYGEDAEPPGEEDPSALGPADEDAAQDVSSVENIPGRHDHIVTVDGLTRELIVYVPEAAAGPAEAPVVFMFHGTSGDGERFYNISGWRESADAEGHIAVFPSALTHCFFEDENGDGDFDDRGERKVTTKWAAGKLGVDYPLCTDDEIAQLSPGRQALVDHPLADDLAFFDVMLEVLRMDYSIDSNEVYTSGFSNGGAMSSFLAAHRATEIAAAHAAAGMLHPDHTAPAERPLSMAVSIGELDDGFRNAMGVDAIPLDETLLELPVAQALIARYLQLLELTPDYTFDTHVVGGRTIARFTFSTSRIGAGNELQFAVIEGLHHQYPNGRNHPLTIADPLWTFFSGYSLD